MILRLTENVPEVYVDESRDFQLLCRLYDLSNQEIRFNILTMLNSYTPTKFSNRMLHLLADRVGFKTNKYIDDRVLRYILAAFPYIIKNKGTKLGIEQAVNTVLKAENSIDPPYVDINKDGIIIITTPITVFNKTALEELLKYVIPAGYYYNIKVGTKTGTSEESKVFLNGGLGYIYQPNTLNDYKPDNLLGIVRKSKEITPTVSENEYEKGSTKENYGETEDSVVNNIANKYIGAVGTTVVTDLN